MLFFANENCDTKCPPPHVLSSVSNSKYACLYKSHVSPWAVHTVLTQSGAAPRVLRSEPEPEEDIVIGVADLVQDGSIVAVAAQDDPSYDFYLIKVTAKTKLTSSACDDYGSEFPAHTSIESGDISFSEKIYWT